MYYNKIYHNILTFLLFICLLYILVFIFAEYLITKKLKKLLCFINI